MAETEKNGLEVERMFQNKTSDEKDVFDRMTYTLPDGRHYEVSYSQILQGKINDQLRLNSYLLWVGLLALLIVALIGSLLLLNTGIIGTYASKAIC